MAKIIEFKPKEPEDFHYMVHDDGKIEGVIGKNVNMIFLEGDDGFMFNDKYISRDELIAFVLISGLWQDLQDDSSK